MVQTQYSKAIKVFRSDNAREYRQTDFSTILKQYGTIFHTSCAGTSQQNGRAECKLRHILDTVRALTNAASTPAPFWGEAALTAMYTINRCPSPIVQNTTPYERLFGTTPNYSLLKVFGCICFVFLQLHEHTKLQPHSQLCCFLGYHLEERGTGVLIQSPSVFESLGMWYSGNTKCFIPYLYFLQVILILRLILYQISSLRFFPLLLSQLILSPTSLPLLIPHLMSLLQPILPSTSLLSLPLLQILSTLLLLSPIALIE